MNNEFVFVTRWVLTDKKGTYASNSERCPSYDRVEERWVADEGTAIERMQRSDPRNWVVINRVTVAAFPYYDREEEKKKVIGNILYGLVCDLSLRPDKTTESIEDCYANLSEYLRNPEGCKRTKVEGSMDTYTTSCGSTQVGDLYGLFCRSCGDKVIRGD